MLEIDINESLPALEAPPIIEAVIEIRSPATAPLAEDSLRGSLAERLADYPVRKAQRQLHVATHIADDAHSTHSRREWNGIRAETSDGLQIAQFNRDAFVFSRLAPYLGWKEFCREALRLWELHRELTRPVDVQRVGVRFINRIPLGNQSFELGQVLVTPPQPPGGLPLILENFIQQETCSVPGHAIQIVRTRTIQPATPPETTSNSLILDVDVFTTQVFDSSGAEVPALLDKMRWLKDKVFFGTLQPQFVETLKRQ